MFEGRGKEAVPFRGLGQALRFVPSSRLFGGLPGVSGLDLILRGAEAVNRNRLQHVCRVLVAALG